MAKSGDVLSIPELGVRIRFLETAAETGGAHSRFEVAGRPCGFLVQAHVHLGQTERFEPVDGAMELVTGGRTHLLRAGDALEVPPGTAHTQRPAGLGDGTVHITVTPAGRTEAFLQRLAAFSRDGRLLRGGWPRPTAAAELVRDFGDEGHAAKPPVAVQRAAARAILGGARVAGTVRARAAAASGNEYLFVDEWDVAAPPHAVFAALADARTYPSWWTPVYLDVEADGPPALGKESRQHFKGRLPYHLHTRSRITRLEPPHVVEGDVDGDLRGRGTWTLTSTPTGTHVRFDWCVYADRPLLRVLTPVLRPAFRWNHAWAIARAMDGLEPFARRTAESAGAPTVAHPALPDDALPSVN
jgi:uncharacterized protein YndB with AHSA1/START domain/mannose-6-phosphate isomerase-like protein (cupin superfamily)